MTGKIILIILAVMNVLAFADFGLDKRRAENRSWRISEKALIMLAVLGGSAGALAGMLAFHHKTRKPLFVIGIPLILLVQLGLAVFVLLYMNR